MIHKYLICKAFSKSREEREIMEGWWRCCKSVHPCLKLKNKFSSLQEECSITKPSNDKEDQTFSSMFFIGKRNVFKLWKINRFIKSPTLVVCEESLVKRRVKSNDMKVSKTSNQSQALSETSEKVINIVNKKKKDLNKCRTCHFKKRKCVLKSSDCKAANLHCFLCMNPGHLWSFVKLAEKVLRNLEIESMNMISINVKDTAARSYRFC